MGTGMFRFLSFVIGAAIFIGIVGLTTPATETAWAEEAFPRKNPLAGDEEAIKEGARLYFKWCVACHGKNVDGVSRFGEYGADLRNFWRGYCDYVVIVLNGRVEKQMPPWGGVLDETEIAQIGAFIETHASEKAVWEGRCTLL